MPFMAPTRKAPMVAALAVALSAFTWPSMAQASYAAKKQPVTAYVLAWRQSAPKTLLVAYRAKSNTLAAQAGTCTVHAKPSVKLPKPGYYSFTPQHFALPGPKSRYTYIGSFTLPPSPAVITVKHVWVSCS
jgi:hypothetical protein